MNPRDWAEGSTTFLCFVQIGCWGPDGTLNSPPGRTTRLKDLYESTERIAQTHALHSSSLESKQQPDSCHLRDELFSKATADRLRLQKIATVFNLTRDVEGFGFTESAAYSVRQGCL